MFFWWPVRAPKLGCRPPLNTAKFAGPVRLPAFSARDHQCGRVGVSGYRGVGVSANTETLGEAFASGFELLLLITQLGWHASPTPRYSDTPMRLHAKRRRQILTTRRRSLGSGDNSYPAASVRARLREWSAPESLSSAPEASSSRPCEKSFPP